MKNVMHNKNMMNVLKVMIINLRRYLYHL